MLTEMKAFSGLIWLALILSAFSGCKKDPALTPPPPAFDIDPIHGHLLHAQPKLPTLKVYVDHQEVNAEIARTLVEIATGMMFRTNMPENEAMLFVFDNADRRSFYMRNCFIPLSAAYISPAGEILEIINMKPQDERPIPSQSENVQFVLEVPHGWFNRHNLGVGSMVRTERGSLQETFFK
jgi:uncharacterized membrane protein (UPF0127 family)